MKPKLPKPAPSFVLAVIAALTVALTPVTGVAQGGRVVVHRLSSGFGERFT